MKKILIYNECETEEEFEKNYVVKLIDWSKEINNSSLIETVFILIQKFGKNI